MLQHNFVALVTDQRACVYPQGKTNEIYKEGSSSSSLYITERVTA